MDGYELKTGTGNECIGKTSAKKHESRQQAMQTATKASEKKKNTGHLCGRINEAPTRTSRLCL